MALLPLVHMECAIGFSEFDCSSAKGAYKFCGECLNCAQNDKKCSLFFFNKEKWVGIPVTFPPDLFVLSIFQSNKTD